MNEKLEHGIVSVKDFTSIVFRLHDHKTILPLNFSHNCYMVYDYYMCI